MSVTSYKKHAVRDDGYEKDFLQEVAAGNIPGKKGVNKFGLTTNADNGVSTDIWSRANATDDQDIWVAPTTARIHDITSTSTNDTAAGTGLRTMRVYGLTSWTSKEVSEVVTMNGTSNVATANAYVIIHRKKALTWGSAGPNVGQITATAQTDATVTAQIEVGAGQTQMAIYGIPSVQSLDIIQYYASLRKAVKTAGANAALLVNQYCDNELTGFVTKHTKGMVSIGSGNIDHQYKPYNRIAGPAIIKLQVETDTDNCAVDGGFDGILVDN